MLAEDCQGQNPDLIAFSVMIPDLNELISFYDHRFKNLSQSSKSNLFCWILRDLAIYVNLKQWLKHKKFSNARIFILGSIIKKRGLDALLYEQSYHIALKYNIKMASGSQIADINLEMINPLKRMGKVSFLWRVYRFDI